MMAATKNLDSILNLNEFEQRARSILPRPLFGYIKNGVEDEVSTRSNRSEFEKFRLITRILRQVDNISTSQPLFGTDWDLPFGVAPMGILGAFAFEGDIALARAAKAHNLPFIQSGASLMPMEKVIAANPDAWFQAYFHYSNDQIDPMLQRIRSAGFKTLVVTVDTAVGGNRENNMRVGFRTPLRPSLRLALHGISRPGWLVNVMLKTLMRHGMPHFENSSHLRGAPLISPNAERDYSQRGRLNWEHIKFIRDQWSGRLVVKGILSPQDVALAAEAGVDGVILSNHGGRQLDGTVSPLEVLQSCVAVAGGMPVMIDSGFRRGTDVIKALALGASFVFAGRPFAFAVAVDRERGPAHAFDLLASELKRDMAMLGCTSTARLNGEYLRKTGP